jgi:hypothetical protein
MKKAILFAVGLLGAGRHAYAQQQPLPIDSTTHKITYSAVVQVPGASQAELYGRALRWLATVEARNTNVPPITDATSGTLIATVGQPFTGRALVGSIQCTLWRVVSVRVKDGRFKYEAYNFEIQPYVASEAALTPPSKAQLKLTPAEEYLNHSNTLYYTKQGAPKAYAASILDAIAQQSAAQAASLKAALTKSSDF